VQWSQRSVLLVLTRERRLRHEMIMTRCFGTHLTRE
jgi:hypothetical protein